MRTRWLHGALCFCVLLLPLAPHVALAQDGGRFGGPPQYERDREYHTVHLALRIALDWESRSLQGTVAHTIVPLRDGLKQIHFDAGAGLRIIACKVNRNPAQVTHEGDSLAIDCAPGLPRGRPALVEISYKSAPPAKRDGSGMSEGYHWVIPDRFEPEQRPGFWSYGWPTNNHNWVPLYDYPNDRVTSDVYVTVPHPWYAVSTGRLVGTADSGSTRTFHWRMDRSFPTYLLSLAAGEMDVVQATVDGTPLMYDVPRGEAALVQPSFAHTPDMIRFYSRTLGVPYPWPKYAQSALFDFGGGMENVSATSLTEYPLTDERGDLDGMDSLISHELAHQWFGDLVTYRDWSQAWVSEGFATFLQMLYFEHSRGRDAYDREREHALQAYLRESRRYRRAIVTRNYPAPWSMLDAHTYPKAALVLHMLRRQMGDADLFRSLGFFLRRHACKPVDTHDLERTIAESTGRNVEAFVDQWIDRPGHPAVEYDWNYDAGAQQVVLHIRQVQDTSDGTPIYRLEIPVGTLRGAVLSRSTVTMDSASGEIRLACDTRPDSVLLDPDHDLLMERRPRTWQPGEQESVMRHAPCSVDREEAAISLLTASAGDDVVGRVLDSVLSDASAPLKAGVLAAAERLKRESARTRFRQFLRLRDAGVRAAALDAVAQLPVTPEDTESARSLVNVHEPYAVVRAALAALGAWDADANLSTLRDALAMDSRHDVIRVSAIEALGMAKGESAQALVATWAAPSHPRAVRLAAVDVLLKWHDRPLAAQALLSCTRDEDPEVRTRASRQR